MSTHRHSRKSNGHHHGKNGRAVTRNLPGKLITLVQLLMTVIFVALLWNSGMVPGKYLAAFAIVLFVLFGVMFGLQFLRSKIYILGIVLSVADQYRAWIRVILSDAGKPDACRCGRSYV